MHLHSDWSYIEHQFGCTFPDRFLMALRAFDNTKSVTPFLLEKDGQRFGLFLQVPVDHKRGGKRLPPLLLLPNLPLCLAEQLERRGLAPQIPVRHVHPVRLGEVRERLVRTAGFQVNATEVVDQVAVIVTAELLGNGQCFFEARFRLIQPA